MDSIAIKYHDKGKRKFFWTIWEKKSGNYESYEDFKRSWDPKTNIWDEIKSRTNKDVRTDVEGILGVGRDRRGIEYSSRRLAGRNVDVRTDVNNLIRQNKSLSPSELEKSSTVKNNETKDSSHRSRSKHSHKHSHKHSSHSHSSRRHDK
jgi:hypothetical protein